MHLTSATISISGLALPSSTRFSSSRSVFYNTTSGVSLPTKIGSRNKARSLVLGQPGIRPERARKRFSCNALFGLGVPELVVIAGVAALVFGPKKLPEVGKSIGKTVKSFQQAAKEFESELKKEPDSAAEPDTVDSTQTQVSSEEKGKEVSSSKESV